MVYLEASSPRVVSISSPESEAKKPNQPFLDDAVAVAGTELRSRLLPKLQFAGFRTGCPGQPAWRLQSKSSNRTFESSSSLTFHKTFIRTRIFKPLRLQHTHLRHTAKYSRSILTGSLNWAIVSAKQSRWRSSATNIYACSTGTSSARILISGYGNCISIDPHQITP